nr:SCO family protein [arsenite-oxidising bacterium NT-25]
MQLNSQLKVLYKVTREKTLWRVRILIWAAVAALLLLAGGAVAFRALTAQQAPKEVSFGEPNVRSKFSLTSHTGQSVTEANFAGKWQLVFFGFTHCPDICPTTLAYMATVLDLLGPQADQIAPLFVTVDPARDTASVMAEYIAAFHPRLIGLTGTEEQVSEAAQNFRTWYERVEDATAPDGYMMAHAGHIYLMDPAGRFVDVYQERDHPPQAIADEIRAAFEKEEQQR